MEALGVLDQIALVVGFDGVEIRNSASPKLIDLEAEEYIAEAMNDPTVKHLFQTAGLDFHTPLVKVRYYTEILTSNHSVEGVLQALREGKTKIYSPPDYEQEKNRTIPEKGTIIKNPKMLKLFKKWAVFAIPGLLIYTLLQKICIAKDL